jgi:hypothetical protein
MSLTQEQQTRVENEVAQAVLEAKDYYNKNASSYPNPPDYRKIEADTRSGMTAQYERQNRLPPAALAEICYEAWRAYAKHNQCDDMLPWVEAPPFEREDWTDQLTYAMQMDGCGDPPHIPDMHQRWLDRRLAAGWVFYTQRSDDRRLHPDLKPLDQLAPDAQRRYKLILAVLGVLHPGRVAEWAAMHPGTKPPLGG